MFFIVWNSTCLKRFFWLLVTFTNVATGSWSLAWQMKIRLFAYERCGEHVKMLRSEIRFSFSQIRLHLRGFAWILHGICKKQFLQILQGAYHHACQAIIDSVCYSHHSTSKLYVILIFLDIPFIYVSVLELAGSKPTRSVYRTLWPDVA